MIYGCQVSSKMIYHFYVEYVGVSFKFSLKKSHSIHNFDIFGIEGITDNSFGDLKVPNEQNGTQ